MSVCRAYYSCSLSEFIKQSKDSILGYICSNCTSQKITDVQRKAWEEEIRILQNQFRDLKSQDGRIIFEYTIPRMGKRVDVVILYKDIVFILEFKCGGKKYEACAYNQVYDYALDLRNFQKESHDKLLAPILVSTKAADTSCEIQEIDKIIKPIRCNADNIIKAIDKISDLYVAEEHFDYIAWEKSEYLPTPTIVEAAQALYSGHDVHEITRNDAGAENLSVTTKAVNDIIKHCKENNRKAICFITGVPGSGKTLAGLNIAVEHSNTEEENAVFLSGNYPLVTVLQEALARDKVEQARQLNDKIKKDDALREAKTFIQIIHKYRDAYVGNDHIPPEHIVIFDEAQRAWTQEKIENFMRTKKRTDKFEQSEPEFLISTMDRRRDWAVVVCLVGGGQEINTGEAGLPEWFNSLRRSFREWDVYVTSELNDTEYLRAEDWEEITSDLRIIKNNNLHLSTSIRSFRTPDLANLIKAILEVEINNALVLAKRIKNKYPIYITRDLNEAKKWVRERSQGTTRYGLLASSSALRLKPEGIFVKNKISIEKWFLNDKNDVRSSYALEDTVTEFDIQGLELDYTIVAWDADFRFDGKKWTYHRFHGNE